MPKGLSRAAQSEWRALASQFNDLGLTGIDSPSIAAYCQAYARWKQAEAALEIHGTTYSTDTGYVRTRPEVNMSLKYMALCRQYAAEIGLTPASRNRMNIAAVERMSDFEREAGFPD